MQGTAAGAIAHGTSADPATAAAEAEPGCSSQKPSAALAATASCWKRAARVAEAMTALDPPDRAEYERGCSTIRDFAREARCSRQFPPAASDDDAGALDATVLGLLHAARAFPRSESVQSAALAALCEMVGCRPLLHDQQCGAIFLKPHFLPECQAAASAIAFRVADDGLELIAAAAARFSAAPLLQRDALVVVHAVLEGLQPHLRNSAADRLIKAGLPDAAVAAIYELVQPAAAGHSGEAALPGEPFCSGGAWSTVRLALLILLGPYPRASSTSSLNAEFLRRALAEPATVAALVRALRFEVAFWRAHLASAPGALASGRLPDAAGEVAAGVITVLLGLITHSGSQKVPLSRAFVRAGGHVELLAAIDGLISADASVAELKVLRPASILFGILLNELEWGLGAGPLAQPAAVLAEGRRLTARAVLVLQSRAPPDGGVPPLCVDAASDCDEYEPVRLKALGAALSALRTASFIAHDGQKWASPLSDESLVFRATASCCSSLTCLMYGDVLIDVVLLLQKCSLVGARENNNWPAATVRLMEEAAREGHTDAICKARGARPAWPTVQTSVWCNMSSPSLGHLRWL